MSVCRDSGTFTPTTAKCLPIPCTQDDVTLITPSDGIFFTEETAETIEKDEVIAFSCTDSEKVPNNGEDEIETRCLLGGEFENPEWPGE